MRITLNKRRDHGLSVIAAIILIVLLLVFIGTLFWAIWKAIQRIPTPHKPDEAAFIQQVVNDEVAVLQDQHPGEVVTVQAVSVSYATQSFSPFSPASVFTTIERSTNFVHWEIIGMVLPGQTFTDTNPPPIQAFYRYYTK